MDEEIERLVIGVRADTAGFARDVAAMRGELDGPLVAGADRAGRAIESALLRAARTGKFGFEDLKSTILSLMNAIAAAAVQGAFGGQGGGYGGGGGGGSGAGGDLGLLYTFISGLLGGSPGRATGGPVSPGRPYWVGERGPELFVPTASGRVEAGGGGAREVRVAITVNAMAGAAPQALQRSGRQVARAVRAALEGA